MVVARQFIARNIWTAIRPVGYGMTPTRRVCCYIEFTLIVQIIQAGKKLSDPGWHPESKRREHDRHRSVG
jgi:hypothetical protein